LRIEKVVIVGLVGEAINPRAMMIHET